MRLFAGRQVRPLWRYVLANLTQAVPGGRPRFLLPARSHTRPRMSTMQKQGLNARKKFALGDCILDQKALGSVEPGLASGLLSTRGGVQDGLGAAINTEVVKDVRKPIGSLRLQGA